LGALFFCPQPQPPRNRPRFQQIGHHPTIIIRSYLPSDFHFCILLLLLMTLNLLKYRMMKMLYAIVLAATLFFIGGCRSTMSINQPKPSPATILQPAISLINRCSIDTSLNTMAYKAEFDTTTTSLVVYLGKSRTNYSYMWEVPLKEIDKSGFMLYRVDYNLSSITLTTIGSQPLVKYSMDNRFKSKSSQFVLYLGKCFSSDEKDLVLQKLYSAIVEAQRK
jgi:hypothetical protein